MARPSRQSRDTEDTESDDESDGDTLGTLNTVTTGLTAGVESRAFKEAPSSQAELSRELSGKTQKFNFEETIGAADYRFTGDMGMYTDRFHFVPRPGLFLVVCVWVVVGGGLSACRVVSCRDLWS